MTSQVDQCEELDTSDLHAFLDCENAETATSLIPAAEAVHSEFRLQKPYLFGH